MPANQKNGANTDKRCKKPEFRGNVVSGDDARPSYMEFFGNVGGYKHKNKVNYE